MDPKLNWYPFKGSPDRRSTSPEERAVFSVFKDSINAGNCNSQKLQELQNARNEGRITPEQCDLLTSLLVKKLEGMVNIDPLTRVFNRAFFEQTLDKLLEELNYSGPEKRKGESVMVIFIDIDRFKNLNDEHGHLTGDEALVTVANRITKAVKSGDMVFRLGGDEFAMLLKIPAQNLRTLESIFKEIEGKRLKDLFVMKGEGMQIPIQLSMGFATLLRGGENMTKERLIEIADKKMYKAKAARIDKAS